MNNPSDLVSLVEGGFGHPQVLVVGAAEVRGWGGRLELVPLVAGCSTTSLIGRSAEPAAPGAHA